MSKDIKLFKELYSIFLPFLCLDLENNIVSFKWSSCRILGFLLCPYMFDYKEKYKKQYSSCSMEVSNRSTNFGFEWDFFAYSSEIHTACGPTPHLAKN